jgi:hypothetical protein
MAAQPTLLVFCATPGTPIMTASTLAMSGGIALIGYLERFRAKWAPVRVKKTRQNKKSRSRE